jgi:uncharacterized protein DUF4124
MSSRVALRAYVSDFVRLAILATIAVSLARECSAGTIYKCKGADGKTTFSDIPCAKDAEPVKIWDSQMGGSATASGAYFCNVGAAPPELVQACLEVWKPTLRDPHSGYADSGVIVVSSRTKARSVFIDGHARNGFGGINALPMECGLTADNAIDPKSTADWVKLRQAFSGLNVTPSQHDVRDCPEARAAGDDH